MLKTLLMAVFLWAAQNPGPTVTGATARGTSCPVVPSPAPVSYWSLQGDTTAVSGCVPTSSTLAYDSGGGGNSGTWYGTAGGSIAGTYYSTISGRTSATKAGFFDGSTTGVNAGSSSTLLPASITVIAWVYGSSFPDSYNSIVSFETSAAGGGSYTILVKSSGKLAVYLTLGAGIVSYDGSGVYTLSANTWYPVAFTFSTASGLIGYVGPNVDATVTTSYAFNPNPTANFLIGDSFFSGRRWTGYINDVGVWNTALTQSQIASIEAIQAFNVIPELRPLNRPVWAYGAAEERLMFYRRRLAA